MLNAFVLCTSSMKPFYAFNFIVHYALSTFYYASFVTNITLIPMHFHDLYFCYAYCIKIVAYIVNIKYIKLMSS